MEIGNFEFHIHKWVHDSQGAIYCIHCRKFKGWMPGEIKTIREMFVLGQGDGTVKRELVDGVQGWGYLLNGEEWKKKKEIEIELNGGIYI